VVIVVLTVYKIIEHFVSVSSLFSIFTVVEHRLRITIYLVRNNLVIVYCANELLSVVTLHNFIDYS